jgi:hypothetical protein
MTERDGSRGNRELVKQSWERFDGKSRLIHHSQHPPAFPEKDRSLLEQQNPELPPHLVA